MCSSHPKPTESLAQARSIYHRSSLAQVKLKQVRFGGGQVEAGQVWLGSSFHVSSLRWVRPTRVKFGSGLALIWNS